MCIFCGCNFQFHVNVKDLRQVWKLNLSHRYISLLGFTGGTVVKNPPAAQETQEILVHSTPGSGRPLESEMATHSSILPWKVLWTEEPCGLQSMALQKSQI